MGLHLRKRPYTLLSDAKIAKLRWLKFQVTFWIQRKCWDKSGSPGSLDRWQCSSCDEIVDKRRAKKNDSVASAGRLRHTVTDLVPDVHCLGPLIWHRKIWRDHWTFANIPMKIDEDDKETNASAKAQNEQYKLLVYIWELPVPQCSRAKCFQAVKFLWLSGVWSRTVSYWFSTFESIELINIDITAIDTYTSSERPPSPILRLSDRGGSIMTERRALAAITWSTARSSREPCHRWLSELPACFGLMDTEDENQDFDDQLAVGHSRSRMYA